MYHFVIYLILTIPVCFAGPLKVVSYNVENLFHPAHDSVAGEPKEDLEWTPEGSRRWSYKRYYQKEENIARVLTNIGEWEGVDVVGLQEVENAAVVKRLCYTLRRNTYDFVHYESPDKRGIDVALIYKKARIDTLSSKAFPVKLSQTTSNPQTTRDILYVNALIDKRDTVHFFVCHMPSQRGGKAESEWKREAARGVLERAVDSVFGVNPQAKIIVMGDMNSETLKINGLVDKLVKSQELKANSQLSIINSQLQGTHKYQGEWSFLDHFLVSETLDSVSRAWVYDAEWIMEKDEKYMGLKPKRTYNGFRYQNGYSDHLPIVLMIDN